LKPTTQIYDKPLSKTQNQEMLTNIHKTKYTINNHS